MNKKKLVATVVSLVMAGTLATSLTACGKDPEPEKPSHSYAPGTTVSVSIGYQTSDTTGITFSKTALPLVNADGSATQTEMTLPDGTKYQKSSLKPMWKTYQEALDVTIADKWTMSSKNLPDCVQNGLENYDVIGAGSLDDIQTQITAGTLLDFNKYKEYLPNLMHFLDNNALAKLGVLNNAKTGAFYYSPYYAGMNDAERYNLFRKDYVSQLLDYDVDASKNGGTVTFKYQTDAKKEKQLGNRKSNETYVGTKASIESYMGKTGSYVVETTNPADTLKTLFVKVNYDAALTAAKNPSTPLGKAIADGAGKTYDGTSGNVVDLQNFVINAKNGEVKGEHLLNVLRAYIDVAYEWSDTKDGTFAKFYNATVKGVTTKRSDIINSTYAAWDVDIYAAIGRCFVTCGNLLGSHQAQTSADTNNGASTWLFVPRTGYTNRTTRLTAMIGELYGVRGMEGMAYLDSSGNRRETRFNVDTWDALSKFSAFHTEGLVPSFNTQTVGDEIGSISSNSACSVWDGVATHFQGLSSNDFIHTQTTISGNEHAKAPEVQTTDGYKWTGVVTPVSRWLTNDTSTVSATGALTAENSNKTLAERPAANCTVMRFTESALKLKTGGIVIPKSTANDPNRLYAALAFVDYLYSNDGLIVSSFGDMSTKDNLSGSGTSYTTDNDGWWYGKPVTSLKIDGTDTDVSKMSMEDLAKKGVVETYDGGKQYTVTKAYQSQALVYKNKLYVTGVNDANDQYSVDKGGYVYNGVMTPYFTRAVRKLCLEGVAVNGYKVPDNKGNVTVWNSTNLQNLVLGQEGFGVVNNAGMVQLCNEQAVEGFDIFGVALGNGSTKTVEQAIGSNPWYTCNPNVTLPKSSSETVSGYTGFTKLFGTGSKITNYFILEYGWYGPNAAFTDFGEVNPKPDGNLDTPQKVVEYLKKIAPQQENLNNSAWQSVYGSYKK